MASKSSIKFTPARSYFVKLREASVRTVSVPPRNRRAHLSERKSQVLTEHYRTPTSLLTLGTLRQTYARRQDTSEGQETARHYARNILNDGLSFGGTTV